MSYAGFRFAVLALAAAVGQSQTVISAKAGLVYFVTGNVSIAGSGPLAGGSVNRQLSQGDILVTADGRAEVLLNPGTVLRIGANTRVRMDSLALTDTHLSLESGSTVMTLRDAPKLAHVTIHAGNSIVTPATAGIYRLDADSPPALRVFRGEAEASEEQQPVSAKRGQSVRLSDLQLAKFNPHDADEFQQWAETRGTPPPTPMLPAMICLSPPSMNAPASATKMADFQAYLKECQHLDPR
ncbi:MAG TPA: FecR domain-containing protein [Bryobacteraceae bacterium]|jgi:hypothetical protein